MEQFLSVPVRVTAERWNGVVTYDGLIFDIWTTTSDEGLMIRGVLASTYRRTSTQVISKGDWIVRYPNGALKSFPDHEFRLKFKPV